MEQYSKRPSLRIAGLGPFPPQDNKFCEKVIDLAADIGVKLTLNDIDRTHPTGRDKKGLIVRFTNYTARFNVYSNRLPGLME
jgi:hypothetical protein